MRQSIVFALVLSLFAVFVSAANARDYGRNHGGASKDYFTVKIRTPGNKYIAVEKYRMDMKDGTFGFGRPGATIFKGYINGTEQGNSYLITRNNGFGFLLEDEHPLYDFKYDFVIPPTDFKAYWSVEGGLLACHEMTDGFKYFPNPDGAGYVIRWDTRASEGSPVQMIVD